MAVLGHNYSIFLIERDALGQLSFRGGAGGATAFGGAIGIWPASALIILPVRCNCIPGCWLCLNCHDKYWGIGHTDFLFRAIFYNEPWIYVFYGVAALIMCLWALRPNFQRLRNGTERKVGFRAKRKKREPDQFGRYKGKSNLLHLFTFYF